MKKLPVLLLVLAMLAGLGPVLRGAAAAADRFDRTKARIDALLNHRLKPEALPAKPANPFLFTLPGSVVDTPVAPVIPEPTANILADDDQILAFCVSRLRISGQVTRGGRAHLLINSNTYKEADLIPVRGTSDAVYYVKIVRITPTEVVFGYNAATVTFPLRI